MAGLTARFQAVTGRLRRDEEGFTIIEVLAASFILVLASLAVFMTFAVAVKNVQRSREGQIGISVAQREIERVRVIPYDSIRLSSTPARVFDARSPFNRVESIGGVPSFDVDRDTAHFEYQELVVPQVGQPTGEVAAETPGVRSDDGTEVTVYRFVTCEEEDGSGNCLRKRVVIDVLPTPKGNLANYERRYYELQSTIADPDAGIEP